MFQQMHNNLDKLPDLKQETEIIELAKNVHLKHAQDTIGDMKAKIQKSTTAYGHLKRWRILMIFSLNRWDRKVYKVAWYTGIYFLRFIFIIDYQMVFYNYLV